MKSPLYNILAKPHTKLNCSSKGTNERTLTEKSTAELWKLFRFPIQDMKKHWVFNSWFTKEQLCRSFILFLEYPGRLPFKIHKTHTTGYAETVLMLPYRKGCHRNRKSELSFQGLWHYCLFPMIHRISEWKESSFIAQPNTIKEAIWMVVNEMKQTSNTERDKYEKKKIDTLWE